MKVKDLKAQLADVDDNDDVMIGNGEFLEFVPCSGFYQWESGDNNEPDVLILVPKEEDNDDPMCNDEYDPTMRFEEDTEDPEKVLYD